MEAIGYCFVLVGPAWCGVVCVVGRGFLTLLFSVSWRTQLTVDAAAMVPMIQFLRDGRSGDCEFRLILYDNR